MRQLQGLTALVTGASGGIGRYIARELARAGMNAIVSGRREDALAAAVAELREAGIRAEAVPADLSDLAQAESLIERSEAALAPLDVLVNNAGVEYVSSFTRSTSQELVSTININLTAPILITRHVLPGMLERGRGHIVFMASLAGKVGPAYEGPYAASKAGLIALTQSLRAEYRAAPVGFSVVCPGVVAGDGMYQRMVEVGVVSNRILGTTTTGKIAEKVVAAIRRDVPEVVESGAPIRPMLALSQLAPRVLDGMAARIGLTDVFRRAAAARGRAT
jgi:short-subunit dehydrogenase